MGLMDKVKTGIQNTGSVTSQKIDEESYNSKIRSKNREVEETISKIGVATHAAFTDGKTAFTSEITELCEKVNSLRKEIAEIEAEKEKMKAKAHEERQSRRDADAEKDKE